MNIQSLSIVVPNGYCWNSCPFCVSRMHHEEYGQSIFDRPYFKNTRVFDLPVPYLDRIRFVRDEGCNSMIITGDAEPQQNIPFIISLLIANRSLRKPFYNITLQTTGSGLTRDDIKKMAALGLTTVALSISSFDADRNAVIIGMPEKKKCSFYDIIRCAKEFNLVVRASVNLTDEFAEYRPERYFEWAQINGVDQLTFRKLYASGDSPQAKWIAEHLLPEERLEMIDFYIRTEGNPIMHLPYGLMKYSVHGVSTVLDDDCMSKDNSEDLKYLILRPNGHLYSRWDDPGSLLF